jgi:hypothetical protein
MPILQKLCGCRRAQIDNNFREVELITPWREVAGYNCQWCGLPASHFHGGPTCCQCHQKMGSHYQIPLFTPEDIKFAHEMVAKEKRIANKYED